MNNLFSLFFETGSHLVQAGLELPTEPTITSDSPAFSSADMSGLWHGPFMCHRLCSVRTGPMLVKHLMN